MYRHRIRIDYDNKRLKFNAPRYAYYRIYKNEPVSSTIPIYTLPSSITIRKGRKRLLILSFRYRYNNWLPKIERQLREPALPEDQLEAPENPSFKPSTTEPDILSAPSLNIYCIGATPLLTLAKRPL